MKLIYIIALLSFPLAASAAPMQWTGIGSFHSTAWGKRDDVPVTIKIELTKDRFESSDCWERQKGLTLCSLQSYEIKNGDELWKENMLVGKISFQPVNMNISYSSRGVILKSFFQVEADGRLTFDYSFNYYTGDYVHSHVEHLPSAR